jgi:hypothetical protein
MRQVDSLGMTMNLRETRGRKQRRFTRKIDFSDKMSNESPLLPSPNRPQKPVIPKLIHPWAKL